MNQKITERNFTEFGWITLFFKLMHNILSETLISGRLQQKYGIYEHETPKSENH
jgi:hypothetical protein